MATTPKQKLHGRAFYESIGSPKVVLAPMVDQSEYAWRVLTRSFMPRDGTEASSKLLAYSPMLHSRLFNDDPKYRKRMFEPIRELPNLDCANPSSPTTGDTIFLDGNMTHDRPLTVQFCSNDPKDLLGAARHAAPYCDAVDLNLGCPQGIAKKGRYGAFLQEDWSLIHNLISTLHRELDIPVTAKMRILESKESTLKYAKTILGAGASILTVHGRRREQKGHITGVADWDMLRFLRDNLPPDTVLFANGNILQHEDIQKCLDATGFDAVMSAEGNLCDPSILAPPPKDGEHAVEYWHGPDGKGGYRMDAVLRRYYDIIYRHVLEVDPPHRSPLFVPTNTENTSTASALELSPNKKRAHDEVQRNGPADEPAAKKQKAGKPKRNQTRTQSPNLLAMRPHMFSMLRPLVSKHTHVRDALARASGGDMEAFENVLSLVEEVTREALVEYEAGNVEVAKHAEKKKRDAELPPSEVANPVETSMATVERCWRPWWICQPYVRPLPTEALANGAIQLSKKAREQLQE